MRDPGENFAPSMTNRNFSHKKPKLIRSTAEQAHPFNHSREHLRVFECHGQGIVKRIVIPVHFRECEDSKCCVVPRAVSGVPDQPNWPWRTTTTLKIILSADSADAPVSPEERFCWRDPDEATALERKGRRRSLRLITRRRNLALRCFRWVDKRDQVCLPPDR